MKRRSALLLIGQMHIKTTVSPHVTPIGTASAAEGRGEGGRGRRERDPSHPIAGGVRWYRCHGSKFFLQEVKYALTLGPSDPPSGYVPRRTEGRVLLERSALLCS